MITFCLVHIFIDDFMIFFTGIFNILMGENKKIIISKNTVNQYLIFEFLINI